LTKPLYFYNGTTFELVGPTTPQSPIAYQTSAPTAPATGDLWIDSDGDVDTYNRQLTRYYFVATAGQTSISGIDANGLTLAYVAGSEAVYVNGALQVRGQDYTATNGTSITGLSALAVNDVVEIFAYTAFTVANAYTKSETDGIAAAAPGMRLIVPTSVSVGSGTGSVSAVGTVTFSGASSVTVNDVFSSTYDNYLLLGGNGAGSTRNSGKLTLGATVTGYYSWSVYGRYNSTTVSGDAVSNGNGWVNQYQSSTNNSAMCTYLYGPNLAKNTVMTFNTASIGTTEYAMNGGGYLANNTQYTGFTLTADSGTLSGTISVYGYKD
jgi:hypothetical protein